MLLTPDGFKDRCVGEKIHTFGRHLHRFHGTGRAGEKIHAGLVLEEAKFAREESIGGVVGPLFEQAEDACGLWGDSGGEASGDAFPELSGQQAGSVP
jgi:hypothetical protein